MTRKSAETPPTGQRVSARGPLMYTHDRVCAEEGCKTLLSIYNGSDRCSVHTPLGSGMNRHTMIPK